MTRHLVKRCNRCQRTIHLQIEGNLFDPTIIACHGARRMRIISRHYTYSNKYTDSNKTVVCETPRKVELHTSNGTIEIIDTICHMYHQVCTFTEIKDL